MYGQHMQQLPRLHTIGRLLCKDIESCSGNLPFPHMPQDSRLWTLGNVFITLISPATRLDMSRLLR